MVKYRYQKKDFEINIIQSRFYGNKSHGTLKKLVFVNVKNKKTGVIFEDWLYPKQLRSVKFLNQLINWGSVK